MCNRHDCFYWSRGTDTCDYILIEGHSRGCSIRKCNKFVPTTLKDKKELWAYTSFHKTKVSQTIPKEQNEIVMQLYEDGCTDVKIGRCLNVSPRAVARWRRQRKLKSNFDRYIAGELKDYVE